MINQDFWQRIANVWAKKDEVKIPDVVVDIDIPDDFFEEDSKKFDSLDDFLKDILEDNPDLEEINVTDFFS